MQHLCKYRQLLLWEQCHAQQQRQQHKDNAPDQHVYTQLGRNVTALAAAARQFVLTFLATLSKNQLRGKQS